MLNVEKILKIFFLACVAIIIVNILDLLFGQPFWQITRLFNVGIESNFPTWYQSTLLLFTAYLSYKCYLVDNKINIFAIFAFFLVLMSFDETAMIHENFGILLAKFSDSIDQLHSRWVIVAGPIVGIAGLFFLSKFQKILNIVPISKKHINWGFTVYFLGAFILEASINFLNHEKLETLWQIENILEEAFEMLGILLIAYGLIKYHKGIKFNFNDPSSETKDTLIKHSFFNIKDPSKHSAKFFRDQPIS